MAEANVPLEPAPPPPPPANDTNWMLDLASAVIPDKPVSGRINGKEFVYDHAILQGGALHLLRGTNTPPDLAITVRTFAKQGDDLADKTLFITTNRPPPVPRVA